MTRTGRWVSKHPCFDPKKLLFTKEQLLEYSKQYTVKEISEITGYAQQTIHKYFRYFEMVPLVKNKLSDEKVLYIREDYNNSKLSADNLYQTKYKQYGISWWTFKNIVYNLSYKHLL